MSQDKKPIDWTDKAWKEMLVYQRESLWAEDTISMLAEWMNLKPGMSAIDVGCGLGYLGYTYWPYFGEGGCYIGIDIESELIDEASKNAEKWAMGGEAHFVIGDAYQMPFHDDSVDWVMCQVVFKHMAKPDLALAEMVRVAKPGGLVMCKETDSLAYLCGKHYDSLPELSLDEQLLRSKVQLICREGRIMLGEGDLSIGPRIPRMMKQLGLEDIGIRLNDRVHYLEPPYDDPLQRRNLEYIKKQWLDEDRYGKWVDRERKAFLAAGGDSQEYELYREIENRRISILRQQVEDGEHFACSSGAFYVIKGRKLV